MARSTTIYDLAKHAGVSPSTVSRTLRGTGYVAPATREAVLRAVRELGYRQHVAAASLGTRRAAAHRPQAAPPVLLLDHIRYRWGSVDRECAEILERLTGLGYSPEHARCHGLDDAACRKLIERRNLRGLLLHRFWDRATPPPIPTAIPVVCSARPHWTIPATLVSNDGHREVLEAVERMRARGYRRIGIALLEHEPHFAEDFQRRSAALLAWDLEWTGVPPWRCTFPQLQADWHDRTRQLADWCQDHRLDAVLGYNRAIADALAHAGLRTPDDVGFASLEASDGHAGFTRTAHQQAHLRAVDELDLLIRSGHDRASDDRRSVLVAATWRDGPRLPPR